MPGDPKAMMVRVESSRLVKPSDQGHPPPTTLRVPLSIFDKVTYDTHIAVIYAFRPPIPSNSMVEKGLSRVLSEYREWAGRLGKDPEGNPFILLNDEGVRFIEASADTTLDKAMPFKPSAALLSFHPSLHGVAELVQVQLTRFTCGSLMVGFTAHHLVADGHATSNFLVAWGLASRGLAIDPLPLHDRASFFVPRSPPRLEFKHRGVEFMTRNKFDKGKDNPLKDDIVVHRVHFTKEFLHKLKAQASLGSKSNRPYTTFESLVAHLWRLVTRARGLDGCETTHVRISVNGRTRLSPRVPNEYFGNLVLWAFPRAKVAELIGKPLQFAAELIHDEVAKVNDGYFRSFIDFASSGVVESENLVPTADMGKSVLCPNLEVDSWLRFPFYDLDFGGGAPPYYFMPSYFPVEGMLFILPSSMGDGSIDAFVPLFCHSVDAFKQDCYSLV
ncbi:agmatine coumaroyltransferase-2 [Elaeis guineensis]|uniref:Agmatine coumaroyltransferase-2 n=1 Tax=Elaeis guineensis var. tenera TaxID=51953 RepID=A0A6I9RW35_ELAGV|nr:agmatine coumaroyltransferase-2 [Elaeis guineensis]